MTDLTPVGASSWNTWGWFFSHLHSKQEKQHCLRNILQISTILNLWSLNFHCTFESCSAEDNLIYRHKACVFTCLLCICWSKAYSKLWFPYTEKHFSIKVKISRNSRKNWVKIFWENILMFSSQKLSRINHLLLNISKTFIVISCFLEKINNIPSNGK